MPRAMCPLDLTDQQLMFCVFTIHDFMLKQPGLFTCKLKDKLTPIWENQILYVSNVWNRTSA